MFSIFYFKSGIFYDSSSYRESFAYYFKEIDEDFVNLQKDLDEWVHYYNNELTHMRKDAVMECR